MNNHGTPVSMWLAIARGLYDLDANKSRVTDNATSAEKHVRDYLAQKFTIALLSADPAAQTRIKDLWQSITGERLE